MTGKMGKRLIIYVTLWHWYRHSYVWHTLWSGSLAGASTANEFPAPVITCGQLYFPGGLLFSVPLVPLRNASRNVYYFDAVLMYYCVSVTKVSVLSVNEFDSETV